MGLSLHYRSEFPESRAGLSCCDIEAGLFFPVGTIGPALRQIDEAKRICLAWAMDGVITA
jgi:hypothetical protein